LEDGGKEQKAKSTKQKAKSKKQKAKSLGVLPPRAHAVRCKP
jgi:hypothetical protein